MQQTTSGLRYAELAIGQGELAEPGRRVVIHYVGTLVDDSVFDSSRERGAPFEFALGKSQVIRGFEEGVTGMRVGGKRRLVIPPELGYGERGSPPKIPPSSVLIFEVELLDVKEL
jgi:FKBP-type peptidyl-prolyl cis-trans isomerase